LTSATFGRVVGGEEIAAGRIGAIGFDRFGGAFGVVAIGALARDLVQCKRRRDHVGIIVEHRRCATHALAIAVAESAS
jgi:hypothetical protein